MSSTVNQLLAGISNELHETFGDAYLIYKNTIPQDFTKPCFFLKDVNSHRRQVVGNRYKAEHLFDVHYFPQSSQKPHEEMNDVAETLCDALEYITVESSLINGSDMHWEKVEGVLHFFVSYHVYLKKERQGEPYMEQQKSITRVKEG